MSKEFQLRGEQVREQSKQIILDYMRSQNCCGPTGDGMRQAELFRACGFDWGDQEKAKSSQQNYWIVALLRTLELEGKVSQVFGGGPWRLS